MRGSGLQVVLHLFQRAWQEYRERGTVGLALHANVPSMFLYDRHAGKEAQGRAHPAGAGTESRNKEGPQLIGRDPTPAIGEIHADPSLVGGDADGQGARSIDRLHSVAQEVENELVEFRRITKMTGTGSRSMVTVIRSWNSGWSSATVSSMDCTRSTRA